MSGISTSKKTPWPSRMNPRARGMPSITVDPAGSNCAICAADVLGAKPYGLHEDAFHDPNLIATPLRFGVAPLSCR